MISQHEQSTAALIRLYERTGYERETTGKLVVKVQPLAPVMGVGALAPTAGTVSWEVGSPPTWPQRENMCFLSTAFRTVLSELFLKKEKKRKEMTRKRICFLRQAGSFKDTRQGKVDRLEKRGGQAVH